jgi:hypothetical protein
MAGAIPFALILVVIGLLQRSRSPCRSSHRQFHAGRILDSQPMAGKASHEQRKTFPVLSIAAEFDGLATLEKVRASLPNLPPTARFPVVFTPFLGGTEYGRAMVNRPFHARYLRRMCFGG